MKDCPSPPPSETSLSTELRRLARLAIPLATVQLGHQLMGATDTAIVGRLGAVSLGAVGLGNALFFPVFMLGAGTIMGLEPMMAQAIGAGNPHRARNLLWQGVWISLLGTALLLPILALLPLPLAPLGIAPDVSSEIAVYMWLRLPGLLPMLLFFPLRQYLQALGSTRPLVVSMVVGNAVNLPTTLLLVFGGSGLPAYFGPLRDVPSLGVGGAALGTSIAAAAQTLITAVAVTLLPIQGQLRRRPDRSDVRTSFRLGMPIALHFFVEILIFATVGFMAGYLEPEALAAHQVALTLAALTFTVTMGISTAGSVRVGHWVGARNTGAARRVGLLAVGMAASFMSLAALLFLLGAPYLARLFTDQPEVIAVAIPLLGVAAAFQLADGIQAVGAGILRGAGETKFTLWANLAGHWAVGLPVALGLGFGLGYGVLGLWWGLCAGLTTVAAALLVRFLRISSRPIVAIEPDGYHGS